MVKEKEHGRYQTNRLHDRLPRDGKRRNQLQKKMGKKMEQVKVLKEVTRMIYPNRMEKVIPIKEFVKNITDKGYKVMLTRENIISGKYDVVIYEEEELKE